MTDEERRDKAKRILLRALDKVDALGCAASVPGTYEDIVLTDSEDFNYACPLVYVK